MTDEREEHLAQLDRLARAHADACRIGDRESASALVRMMARHCAALDQTALSPTPR